MSQSTKKATRFLVTKGSASAPRHYWQPTAKYKQDGWITTTLSKDYATALGEAYKLNERLDKWIADNNSIKPNGARSCEARFTTTIAALLAAWQQSHEFIPLAIATKKYYRTGIKHITDAIGSSSSYALTVPTTAALHQHYAHQPGTATQLVRTGQAAWSWAISTGYDGAPAHKSGNPWSCIKLDTKSDRAQLWTDEDIDAMVFAADTMPDENGILMPSIGTAILMMEWLGHYPQDIIGLCMSNFIKNIFTFNRIKTSTSITVNCSPRLLSRFSKRQIKRQGSVVYFNTDLPLISAEHTGKPWKIDNFRKHFRRIRDAAALAVPHRAGLKMGHLRHTAITRMFEVGIDPMNIAAITGHSLKSCIAILDRYAIRTTAMAKTATDQRLAYNGRHG